MVNIPLINKNLGKKHAFSKVLKGELRSKLREFNEKEKVRRIRLPNFIWVFVAFYKRK